MAESSSAEEKPLLTVYTFDTDTTKYSFSPFATKLRFRLRHAGVPYDDRYGSMLEAPKKKIPYVKFHESGEFVGDSSLIIERMVKAGKMSEVNAKLSPEEKAKDMCIRSMIEDRMYFFIVRYSIQIPVLFLLVPRNEI
jgi:hypothetical protein